MRKPKFNITFKTSPSIVYKTKEEADLMIEKATNLLVKELILNKLN